MKPRTGDAFVAGLFVATSSVLSLLPRAVTIPGARVFGWLASFVMPSRLRVARENLALAFGASMTARERDRMARASFGHAAAIAADLLTLPRVARDPGAHCETDAESVAVLEAARADGRGVILVAGHFGLFESMGLLLGHLGFPVSFIAKPFDNALLDAAVSKRRGATGNSTIHKGGAKAIAREHLARGETIAIVIDQHVTSRDRLWVPFFGLPAATSRSMGVLAIETGAAVVPIHSYPLARGRCRCEFGPVLRFEPGTDPQIAVTAVIAEMERATRKRPSAWLWLHRRWKVRPDGAAGYPSYSWSESEEKAHIVARQARLDAAQGSSHS